MKKGRVCATPNRAGLKINTEDRLTREVIIPGIVRVHKIDNFDQRSVHRGGQSQKRQRRKTDMQ